MAELLQVSNLAAGYDELPVLAEVNLTVAPGETVALVGPNGCGKSTLFRAIVGLLELRTGSVWFDGFRVDSETTEQRVRRGMAYCPQSRNVFSNLTVDDNLLLSAWGLTRREFALRRDTMLDAFPVLRDKQGARAGVLSGGERQSLALGMALLKRAKLYLLDEPASGLSPVSAQGVCKGLRTIQRETGCALLLVEHNPRYLAEWADKAYVMNRGRIAVEAVDVA